MLYLRAVIAFVGFCLIVFSGIRISWQFIRWGVMTIAEQAPPFVESDPRIRYRAEAISLSFGCALVFLASILR